MIEHKEDQRSAERLRQHYEIEKELAGRLRNAPRQERANLYSTLYDELYRRVPDHPQLTRRSLPETRIAAIRSQVKLLSRFVTRNSTFLEVGPGDCALSCEVASRVKQVYAVDVSAEITKDSKRPPNFTLVLSDGSSIPLPQDSINVAYSNQLIEHLHPEDALEQLKHIYTALAPGGVYICCTPNRLGGPWDISVLFDPIAAGFHMKEYTYAELTQLFRSVGFRKIKAVIGVKGRYYLKLPVKLMCLLESLFGMLPYKKIPQFLPFRLLLDLRLAGVK